MRIPSQIRGIGFLELERAWHEMEEWGRPDGVWIGEHEAVIDASAPMATPIVRCWYFDGSSFEERPTSSLAAFLNVSVDQSAASCSMQKGIAGFSRTLGGEEIAFYWQFAGLLGVGYKLIVTDGKSEITEMWRS